MALLISSSPSEVHTIAVTASASCPTASSTPTISSSESTSSNYNSFIAGVIAGEVIGALGFLVALILFLMWFSDYTGNNSQIPAYGRTFVQTNAPGNGNGRGVVLTPVVVTPCNGPASTQRIASWVRRLYRPSKYLDEADMKEANIGQDWDTTRSMSLYYW
ncbi:hypothetical protein J3R30DRAFT_1040344 [Lentinula aciculospora]|uniref:Uncharacterized protein n=1 Tax=Lentinula aciculospora TaxID=153920 RepID=A0A9W9DJI6_9AGAR|nr:hypothetical protein J3R30DRAFT_1040344 [Lentinula aciculospora]